MSGDPRDPRSDAAMIAATPLPTWAAGYKLETRPDGRIFLHAEVDGCDVWAQPKAWTNMKIQAVPVPSSDTPATSAAPTINYGVNIEKMRQHDGKFETNDASFGRRVLQPRATQEAPLPFEAQVNSDLGPYALPALILALGILFAAVLSRARR